tara:strand:+ start:60 stop:938 length:879 start_codon:yes stop_codon:yes gene_type:complete
MKKVIIFGGCGFLGAWLAKTLLNKFVINIFDKSINKKLLIKLLGKDVCKINFIEGDITDIEVVCKAVKNMDCIVNLAGLMTPDCSKDPILGAKVNILGSINIFESIRNTNIKSLVYSSSAGVFGPDSKIYPIPQTHYGAYKLAVEGVARSYYNELGISSVGLRPFVIYGPGREIGRTASLSLACMAAKNNYTHEILFSGSAGFVYVEDVTYLIEKSLRKAPKGANIINVNGITASVNKFVEIINKYHSVSKISIKGENLEVDRILENKPSDYFSEFKYTSLEDGIKRTIDFY